MFGAERAKEHLKTQAEAMPFHAIRLSKHVMFWLVALGIGVVAGGAAVLFRLAIEALQSFFYGPYDALNFHTYASTLPWYWIVLIPTIGGIVVGLIFHFLTPDGRVRSVADVIEATALKDGRLELKEGIASAIASWITLSTGGSAGREGPVVHIAGMLASKVSDWLNVHGVTARDLTGCAVAAAVSASFNAPLAGALFALEVILRHFAIHAFAPIVVASAAGTVVNRLVFGDVTEFNLPMASSLEFYVELPAFLLLGIICGLVAVVLMKAIFFADDIGTLIQTKLAIPRWVRPAIAGLMLGGIATQFPVIIGVGYETTFAALSGDLLLHEAMIFAVLKVIAVAITMSGRMGGGVFSPSLMVGALTGLSFGLIATGFFPEVSGEGALYALAGMGAVSAAVLGAPISTTLIVFEMTGDWQTGLAVMVAVSLSTAISSRYVDHSFFLTLLERRNVHLAAGPQTYLLALFSNKSVMVPLLEVEDKHWDMVEKGLYVSERGTLEGAIPLFERTGARYVPVVRLSGENESVEIVGVLYHLDALKAYNKALAATAAEEHS